MELNELLLMTDELKRDEGFRGCLYQCSAGKWTAGYGHNMEDNPMPEPIAERLLQHDIGQAMNDCERLHWFGKLSDVRKRAIVNMAFNLGITRLCGFHRMILAIEQDDYPLAAAEMIDSKWASQVGVRAQRLAFMMRNDRILS